MKKLLFGLFFLIVLLSANSISAGQDLFSGEWRLFINSSGTEIPDNQPSIVLNISKTNAFYDVEVLLPTIPEVPAKAGWDGFLQASQQQQIQIALQIIKQTYTGKYTLSDDGKIIEHINGSASLQYKKEGNMLYTKDIGCFKK